MLEVAIYELAILTWSSCNTSDVTILCSLDLSNDFKTKVSLELKCFSLSYTFQVSTPIVPRLSVMLDILIIPLIPESD